MLDLSPEAALDACACRSFAAALAATSPFADADALLGAARRLWWRETPVAGWLEAFASHPALGDARALAAARGAFGAASRGEQAAAAGAGAAALAALAALADWNARYAAKFGHVFLLCAAGRTAEEMLAAVRSRCDSVGGCFVFVCWLLAASGRSGEGTFPGYGVLINTCRCRGGASSVRARREVGGKKQQNTKSGVATGEERTRRTRCAADGPARGREGGGSCVEGAGAAAPRLHPKARSRPARRPAPRRREAAPRLRPKARSRPARPPALLRAPRPLAA